MEQVEICYDKNFLRQKSESATLDEAKEISKKLISVLAERKEGDIGLAAPQIGILKKVCIVRAKNLIVLVNPRIVEASGETWYQEGCLSFPGASVRTKRHANIVVEVDYLGQAGDGYMDAEINWQENGRLYFARDGRIDIENDTSLLESVAVQHEIDHLEGILMFDREWKVEQATKVNKQKPNEKCACGSGKKYKKCCGSVV